MLVPVTVQTKIQTKQRGGEGLWDKGLRAAVVEEMYGFFKGKVLGRWSRAAAPDFYKWQKISS